MSNNWTRSDERKDEKAPYSRIFVVCSKLMQEQDLREPFERFGEIEDLYMLKDRNTGNSRGVAYVKYSKTSSAAAAIQEMHLKQLNSDEKPIKVMVATNKNDKNENSTEKHNRLFIKVTKQTTEEDLKKKFSPYGSLESVYIMKDKVTNESKGLAYIQYQTFLEAAKAFEECDRHFKAVFAEPKQDLKRGRDIRGQDYFSTSSHYPMKDRHGDSCRDTYDRGMRGPGSDINCLIDTAPQNFKTVLVTCTPQLSQRHIERLFNIIPRMVHCQYTPSTDYNGCSKAIIKYDDERAAAYAVEKLNNYEFPSGELVIVKPENPLSQAASDLTSIVNSFKNAVDSGNPDLVQLADAIAQASTLIKVATTGRLDIKAECGNQDMNYCSVPLPPVQPYAPPTAHTVQRCFVVCKPQPPPVKVLKDLFCRFGDLVDVITFPNKTFAFAMYASVNAAQDAIKTLHGATVFGGVYLKVLEATEKDRGNVDSDNDTSTINLDRKRMRLIDSD